MAGTYNGSLHDFGTGNLSVSFARQSAILDQGRRNAVKAAQATGKAVVSADGKRLLAEAPRPDPRDYTQGPGRGSASTGGVVVTTGPGGGYVTVRPGAGGVPAGPGLPTVTGGSNLTFGTGPGLGVVTRGDAFLPKDTQLERIGDGGQQESFGAISDIGWSKTANGWQVVPSADMKDRMDDDLLQSLSWHWRNIGEPLLMMREYNYPDFLPGDQKGRYAVSPWGEVTPYVHQPPKPEHLPFGGVQSGGW